MRERDRGQRNAAQWYADLESPRPVLNRAAGRARGGLTDIGGADLIAGQEAQVDIPIAGTATAAYPAVCICTRPRHCAIAHASRYLRASMPANSKGNVP